MDGEQRVWAPHPVEGYQMGTIVDVGADTLSVAPLDAPGQVSMTIYASYGTILHAPCAPSVIIVQHEILYVVQCYIRAIVIKLQLAHVRLS